MTTFFFLARNQGFDVVLVDTAGRMQDNAPLMTALAKLITVNTPDLVLFVGEALVGNEAVDQLVRAWAWFSSQPQLWTVRYVIFISYFSFQVKFNRALADHSMAQTPRLIDGIVLTKFDTIDDKVNVDNTGQSGTKRGNGCPSQGSRGSKGTWVPEPPVAEGVERQGPEMTGYPVSASGGSCDFYDLHHKQTHRLRGHWPDLL